MHTDDQKKFDKRNLFSNLQKGLITQKELESHLSKLPDVSNKAIDPDEENTEDTKETEFKGNQELTSRKKTIKKR